MKNRRRISNIEETIVEPCDVNGKNKIFTSFSLTFFSVYLQLDNILNIYIYIYTYIYISYISYPRHTGCSKLPEARWT